MQSRYALRFENGEREGETVPVTGSGVTVGRRPGNSIQLLDASVSGRHAEFLIEGDGVLLRDLGSTNGSRVAGERVSERHLRHGDEVLLGNVRVTFFDTHIGVPAPAAGGTPASPERPAAALEAPTTPGDTVRTISAEKVRKAGSRSLFGVLGLGLALAAGAAAWWYLRERASGPGADATLPVENVPGNLLPGPESFEGAAHEWENEANAAALFDFDPSSRRSGATGLGIALAAEQWGLARSPAVNLGSSRELLARGHVRAGGGAQARLGLELEATSGKSATTVIWSAPSSGDEFELLTVSARAPECFDRARVVIWARAAGTQGTADVDDVGLVPAAAPDAVAIDEFRVFAHGAPASAVTLFKIDRSLFSDVHVALGSSVAERAPITVTKLDNGFDFELGAGGGRKLALRIDGPLLEGGLATTGSGGYRLHAGAFQREACAGIVAGKGKDQVRLVFPSPIELEGRVEGEGVRIVAELGAVTRMLVQTNFLTERGQAQSVARAARELEKAGRLGAAALEWTRLRDEFPFEAQLLGEAEDARSRIAGAGAGEVRAVRAEIERARFFRLVDLYRQCRSSAEAVAARYAGIDIEAQARQLSVEVEEQLAALEVDLQRTERARLERIALALEQGGSAELARHVRDYVARNFAAVAGAQNGKP
jgi:hypothetical protein